MSATGKYLYGIDSANYLYCFDIRLGLLEHSFKLQESDLLGIVHHPSANQLISLHMNGDFIFYKA